MANPSGPRYIVAGPEAFDELVQLRRGLASRPAGDGTRVADAQYLAGLEASYYLNRANQAGPHFTMWPIYNENAGILVRGLQNGTLCRLYPYAADPANPQPACEVAGAIVTGDVTLPAGAGPVLAGPYYGGRYRVCVRDADPASPQLQLQLVASAADVLATDMEFYQGFSWLQRDRTNLHKWFWVVYDLLGADLDNAKLRVERWAV